MVFGRIVRSWRRRKVCRAVEGLKGLTVRDLMSTYLITIRPDEPITAAATKMIAEAISCLLVMDAGKLVGILTERDFLHKVPIDDRSLRLRVRDVMTPQVVTVDASMPVTAAVKMMKERNFRRIVVAQEGNAIGIVTQNDLLRRLALDFRAYPEAPELALDAMMSKDLLTAAANESFAHARERMHKRNVGCILIVDKAKPPKVQGIFTEYDVVAQFYDTQGKLRVKELDAFMRKYVRSLPAGTNAFVGVRFILDKRIRRIPVSEGERVLGIATETDLVRFIYLSLDKILAAAQKPDARIVRLSRRFEFRGEFKGDHLKVYVLS